MAHVTFKSTAMDQIRNETSMVVANLRWILQYCVIVDRGWSSFEILAFALASVIFTSLFTRFVGQGRGRLCNAFAEGSQRAPMPPYWFPKLGHFVELPFNAEGLLSSARETSPHGIFALHLWGTNHNMIYAPSMMRTLLAQKDSVVNFPNNLTFWFLNTIGGIPSRLRPLYEPIMAQLHHPVAEGLLRNEPLRRTVGLVIRNFEKNIPRLVSLEAVHVEQSVWERRGAAKPARGFKGEAAVEANLMELVTDFVALQALPSVFGTDLFENFPDILSNLWDFNAGFLLLGVGLPAWLPIPPLTKARAGRAAVTAALGQQHQALDHEAAGEDPGPKWRNLDTVSDIIRGRHKLFQQAGIPCDVRSDLSIIWALNANANFAVFWMLLRIFSAPGMVDRLREEIAPYVHVSYSADGQPEMKIDEHSLITSAPLLKACFIETLRLDSSPWAIKKVQKDLILTDTGINPQKGLSLDADTMNPQPQAASYLIPAGDFANVPFDLHFMDPAYFPSPEQWDPYRFIDEAPTPTDPERRVANWRTVHPWGGGVTMCKGRRYAEREVMSCVAGVLAYWDCEPVDGHWVIPRKGKTTAVYYPKDSVRVRFTRRQIRCAQR